MYYLQWFMFTGFICTMKRPIAFDQRQMKTVNKGILVGLSAN